MKHLRIMNKIAFFITLAMICGLMACQPKHAKIRPELIHSTGTKLMTAGILSLLDFQSNIKFDGDKPYLSLTWKLDSAYYDRNITDIYKKIPNLYHLIALQLDSVEISYVDSLVITIQTPNAFVLDQHYGSIRKMYRSSLTFEERLGLLKDAMLSPPTFNPNYYNVDGRKILAVNLDKLQIPNPEKAPSIKQYREVLAHVIFVVALRKRTDLFAGVLICSGPDTAASKEIFEFNTPKFQKIYNQYDPAHVLETSENSSF